MSLRDVCPTGVQRLFSHSGARARAAPLAFESLSIEGGLLSPEWLSKVAQLQAGSQAEADYRIPGGLNLRDEIGRSWRKARAHWADFTFARAQSREHGKSGRDEKGERAATSGRFVVALLRDAFGFASLEPAAPVVLAGRTYPIGYATLGGRVPVVVALADSGLDTRSAAFGDGGRLRSAYGLAQEYLNVQEEALWGIASDGAALRIVRDNASLTRPAWIEADLKRIFTEARYADFAALWLLCHETRFGRAGQPSAECVLEAWRNAGREEGTRLREHVRRGVEEALGALGQGFLSHADNAPLRAGLHSGALPVKDYFDQLLRLVYRLIFLLTVEERGLLHPEGTSDVAKALYVNGYGIQRLRERSVKPSSHDGLTDLWDATTVVCRGLAAGEPRLGLPALGGIFAVSQCPVLDGAKLENRVLLLAVFKLAWLREEGSLARVNWRDMAPEELGSVYESLLELLPQITQDESEFAFTMGGETQGNTRKTTGSYYTPDRLVQVLLDGALEPVIAGALAKHPASPVEALLGLSIVDPACGSGHFLLAAARRLAAHVARWQANGTPSALEYRHALRQVVGRCIFGVDLNPMAVELCRVGLWMEAMEPGLPLTFLSSHVQQGNALLGTTPERMAKGIPDAAWEPIEGDDKRAASALKKRNKKHSLEGQAALWCVAPTMPNGARVVTRATADLDAASEASVKALAKKEERWDGIVGSAEYRHQKFVADAWCAAFLWPKQPGEWTDAAPTNELWRQLRDGSGQAPELTTTTVEALARQHRFFHWHLQFPQIFAKGGFDVVLGNPPWIAHAGRAAQPLLPGVKRFYAANYEAFADYPTTHGLFASVIPQVLRTRAYLGIVVPSSLSELGGYSPTRTAHDRLCEFPGELTDFGEGQFEGVTQPCMALVSRRSSRGRADAEPGEPWPMARPDLTALDRQLLERMTLLPKVPPQLFGERGVQSDKTLAEHFLQSPQPTGRFTTAIREGTDVREFELLPPRFHVDRDALGRRIRQAEEFAAVRVVIRQTARYPIAALSDGQAFRNSLLAAFELTGFPAEASVALLNSALVRWLHYQRFRDARQPVMPQVKIGHLRSIPIPRGGFGEHASALADMGRQMTAVNEARDRSILDRLVAAIYGLSEAEQIAVDDWHRNVGPNPARHVAGASHHAATGA